MQNRKESEIEIKKTKPRRLKPEKERNWESGTTNRYRCKTRAKPVGSFKKKISWRGGQGLAGRCGSVAGPGRPAHLPFLGTAHRVCFYGYPTLRPFPPYTGHEMDWQTHDYSSGSAMAYERASPAANPHQQRQVFSYPQQQQQQFDSPTHPFIPPYPSMQPFHYQVHLHAPSSHPQLHHLQQNPSSVYLPHLAPLLVLPPFNGPYDAGSGASPPPPSAPPLDPELHKRIDKLVEYAGKNGPEFEAMLREKQKDSPDYGFLFGGDGHGYYCYKLWLSARGLGGSFTSPSPPSSAHMMRPPPNPVLSPSHLTAPPIIGGPQMLHASYLYEQQRQQRQHPQPFGSYGRPDYDQSSKPFKGLSGPLPADVAVDLSNVLVFLNGTKESIKAAKFWFMQRSIFAPALAESLRDRIYSVDEPERQLHIIYLINDILFERYCFNH
ncbi:hypothetical protein G4B88_011053 [Cannabis sativa]|uniref:Calcium homeostasis endoplasmic reticulum protein n=1 Tax=Cannabis sativa TaxID=3483 RepID=A0A7J6DKC5_CANSA|nr:hypothetical protein G4B88_011053 [Cannabis sativa]